MQFPNKTKNLKNSTLLVISDHQPLEGSIYTSLDEIGAELFIYHTEYSSIIPHNKFVQMPKTTTKPENDLIFSRILEKFLIDKNIEIICIVGIKAGTAWVKLNITHVDPVILFPYDELSFSQNNQTKVQGFTVLNNFKFDYFFENTLNFSDATRKGSQSRHFLFNQPIGTSIDQIKPANKQGNNLPIALIYPSSMPDTELDQWQYQVTKFNDENHTKDKIELVKDTSLYIYADLKNGRHLNMVAYRLFSKYSALMVVGYGKNTRAILKVLKGAEAYTVVENTNPAREYNKTVKKPFLLSVKAAMLTYATNLPRAVTDQKQLTQLTRNTSLKPSLLYPNRGRSTQSLKKIIFTKKRSNLPPFFEEFVSTNGCNKSVAVFFSTSQINLTAASARPQRIRNMAETILNRHDAIVYLHADSHTLERRRKLLDWLIGQKNKISLFYGENSTSPISSLETVKNLEEILLSMNNVKKYWFVRDLHYFFPNLINDQKNEIEISKLKEMSHFEYLKIAQKCDQIFSPTKSSCKEFSNILSSTTPNNKHHSPKWHPLGPGVRSWIDPKEFEPAAPKPGVTFVYVGGINDIYNLDMYLKAISKFKNHKNLYFDFIVSPQEKQTLLDRLKLETIENAQIISGDFDHYKSDTKRAIGVVLLEGEYPNLAMPYKVMSYLEREMPIIAYHASEIARFIDEHAIGKTCEPSAQGVYSCMKWFVQSAEWEFEFTSAKEKNTWDQRVNTIIDGDVQ